MFCAASPFASSSDCPASILLILSIPACISASRFRSRSFSASSSSMISFAVFLFVGTHFAFPFVYIVFQRIPRAFRCYPLSLPSFCTLRCFGPLRRARLPLQRPISQQNQFCRTVCRDRGNSNRNTARRERRCRCRAVHTACRACIWRFFLSSDGLARCLLASTLRLIPGRNTRGFVQHRRPVRAAEKPCMPTGVAGKTSAQGSALIC